MDCKVGEEKAYQGQFKCVRIMKKSSESAPLNSALQIINSVTMCYHDSLGGNHPASSDRGLISVFCVNPNPGQHSKTRD